MIAPGVALERLEDLLADAGGEAELLLTGGAVMSLVFAARPASRRASALFREPELLTEISATVADEYNLPPDWLSVATRQLVGHEGTLGGGYDGASLRIFSPVPDYALAMKCAEWTTATDNAGRQVEADIRYLLRLTGVRGVQDALERVHTYFGARQLPGDLPERLERLL